MCDATPEVDEVLTGSLFIYYDLPWFLPGALAPGDRRHARMQCDW